MNVMKRATRKPLQVGGSSWLIVSNVMSVVGPAFDTESVAAGQ